MPKADQSTSTCTTTPVTGRRRLAAGLFSIAISSGMTAGAAASVADYAEAAAEPSPIIAAGKQLKGCWDRYDIADDLGDRPGADEANEDKKRREEFILAATPTTIAECALVLLMALAEIDCGQNCQDGFDIIDEGQRVAERATRQLFDLAGLDVSDFAGQFYIRESSAPAGRA